MFREANNLDLSLVVATNDAENHKYLRYPGICGRDQHLNLAFPPSSSPRKLYNYRYDRSALGVASPEPYPCFNDPAYCRFLILFATWSAE
ncbi:hypothetical protein BDV27DRAFT_132224 [Aspergillus caelatus]|uniref:Uncharacterized protein n=1 Tax=Aspergillus caelatus TaxID=61420 RepID=A0A5N6ZWI3_9EURO|nr:uncharacterized protein BDV27DRAFT_132224 [Aspergillus caelatus]KAE8361974.1 hypothetical protein BDV27DRAFT_132224 [Aspergillus caelatus]